MSAKHARKQSANDIAAQVQTAETMRESGRLDEAEKIWRQLLAQFPNLPQPYVGLAALLDQRGKSRDAYELHKKAVGLAPKEIVVWRQLGFCLTNLRQYEAAAMAFRQALDLEPSNTDVLMDLGRALLHMENSDGALAVFDEVLALNPSHAAAYLAKGVQLQTLGEFEEAKACFRKALDIDPNMAIAHFRLASMDQSPDEAEQTLDRLNSIAASSQVRLVDRASALFSAATVLQKQNKYDDAFAQYSRANSILSDEFPFDRDAFAQRIDNTIEGFSPGAFAALKDAGSSTDRPVFIIGMPRSGTTLVETIISSHRHLAAGGEDKKMAELADSMSQDRHGKLRYPRDVGKIDPANMAPFASLYMSHMVRMHPEVPRTTDKFPFNFLHLGLIAVLFPNASIVHCRRDPMDTCLSCFFQYFGELQGLSFTNNLEDLGFCYSEYERLMAHWHQVLPVPILDISYEELVASQEMISRQMIAHIGEEWDEACLQFHEQDRNVNTASHFQVRQPIYKSSVEKWRQYERHLGPLQDALKKAS